MMIDTRTMFEMAPEQEHSDILVMQSGENENDGCYMLAKCADQLFDGDHILPSGHHQHGADGAGGRGRAGAIAELALVEVARRLVSDDKVDILFGSAATPTANAIIAGKKRRQARRLRFITLSLRSPSNSGTDHAACPILFPTDSSLSAPFPVGPSVFR